MYLFEHLSTGTFNSESPFAVELVFGLPRTPRAGASSGRSAGFLVRGRTVNALLADTRVRMDVQTLGRFWAECELESEMSVAVLQPRRG